MDSPGRSRSHPKRGIEEGSDTKSVKAVADEDYVSHEKSKSKSRKSRKSSYGEDRNEHRKRGGGSSKEYSDDDDYGTRKESSYSDKLKMKQEQSTLEKLSNWYGDRDLESKHDGGRAHRRVDETEKIISRKSASKSADTKSKSHDVEHEKEQSKAKVHGSSKHGTDSKSEKNLETTDSKSKAVELSAEKDKSSRSRHESVEEDAKHRDNPEEDKSGREIGHSRRSRTPEKSGSLKRKEDERVKARDRDYERDREWDLPKRVGRDRTENERPLGRIGNRKDGRGEIVKASSNFGISTENYDVIEIQRKPLDSAVSKTNDLEQKSVANEPLPPVSNEESGSQGRPFQQGMKANNNNNNRQGNRTNRIRPSVRDNQPPMHLMGPPFGIPPPGQAMSPAPLPPGVFLSPFPPPVWPGARGLDMTILPISAGASPIVPRFPPPVMFFNQPGPTNASESGFNSMVPIGRGQSHDKVSGGWAPPKSNGPPGKVPSRGEQNDYSQNFVDTGMRPQNFIRELELSNVEDYPKLRELIQKKDEIVAKVASAPMYHKCDLQEFVLSPEFFGTKFDVILVDPPWEEYVHRAPGVTDNMESWTVEQIMNLKIEAIADTPSFIFLWVGDGVGLEQGRQCLKKWGFRRCEDICWVKTNKNTATPALRHDSHTLFQHTKEHCLMGIKGTVRRSTDGHIIHANIDTDVIIAEEPPYGSTAKPDEIYRIIEHFALGCRRIELFGEDHNIRAGWLTLGKGLSSSNFNSEAYTRTFSDKDGKVWQGGGGRNPPPEAPHLVLTTPEIESLRPKSPMKNQQQLQQQSSSSISLTANSTNRKPPSLNSPNPFAVTQEGPTTDHLPPWAPNPFGPRDNAFDVYGYGMPPPVLPLPNREFMEFDPQRTMNNM